MGAGTSIQQLFGKDINEALLGAASPSALNVFATMADISGGSADLQQVLTNGSVATVSSDVVISAINKKIQLNSQDQSVSFVAASFIETQADSLGGASTTFQTTSDIGGIQCLLFKTDSGFTGTGVMEVSDSVSSKGLVYTADYSAVGVLDPRWIPDYGAVTSAVSAVNTLYTSDGQFAGNRIIDANSFNVTFDNVDTFKVENFGQIVFDDTANISFIMQRSGVTLFEFDASSSSNATYIIGTVDGREFQMQQARGLLLPRLGQTQENALTGLGTGLMLINTAENRVRYYDGTVFQNLSFVSDIAITSDANSTTLIQVTQASDIPAVLVSDTTYLIRGSVTISTAITVTNEGCSIIGFDRNKDKLIWDGATGTTMLTVTDVNFDISELCLSANNTGSILIEADNYDGAAFNSGRLKTFTITNCQFRNCYDIASFEGFDLVDISNTLFWYCEAPNFGITFLNTSKTEISSCEFIRWFDESSIPTPSGYATCPMIEILTNGGGAGLGAVNVGGCVIHPQQTQDGIKINSGSTTGFGTISANTFVNVNLTTGLTFFPDPSTGGYSNTECLNYDIAVNQGAPNSDSYMLCTFSGNTNDTDLSSGTPAPIESGSISSETNSQRFSLTETTIGASVNVTPVLEYEGTKDIYASITASLSYDKQGGGVDSYHFSYYMDTGSGYVQLTNSELIIDAGADSDELTVTMVYSVNFSEGDKLAIFCENPSSGDDILVKSLQWLVKE